MEHCPTKLGIMGQLYQECVCDAKSRFWKTGNQSLPKTEVVCPQPWRATMGSFNRFSPFPKGILPVHRGGDYDLEILDIILNKDEPGGDLEVDTNMSFFCGSPPVRANNPIVHDAQFTKSTEFVASPLRAHRSMKPRVERGPPSRGSFSGSPEVRVEGFACGSSDSKCIVQAFA